MTILLTGGTGKTGLSTARRIPIETNYSVLLASRKGIKPEELSGPAYDNIRPVTFDWFDKASWQNPFNFVASENLSNIDRIYLVAPMTWDVQLLIDFIDLALERGVDKFILLSASQEDASGPTTGRVHARLQNLGKEKGVQWMVIRPTWFIENIGKYHVSTIVNQDTIYSVTEDGKVPFISAEDIGNLAADVLVNWKAQPQRWNTDVIIHGPELFNNDQLAELLSEILGRQITHARITKEESLAQWNRVPGYEKLAEGLVECELKIARGSEEAIFRCPGAVEGKVKMKDYIVNHKHLWMKD